MPYRDTEPQPKTGRNIEVRSYLDLVLAELAVNQLRSEGIPAFVVEAASYNPLYAAAVGGHRVLVDESDLERAASALRRTDATPTTDEEPDGTVRCPRCELAYCRRKLHVASLGMRWTCERCDNVWERESDGPKRMTPLGDGDPTPVFLLYRGNTPLGVVLGLALGVGALTALPGLAGVIALFALVTAGSMIGRAFGKYVCSEPSCRKPLMPSDDHCAVCQGVVAGKIRYVGDHYAMAADVRRELAAERRREAAAPKKKPKRRALPEPRTDP